MFKEIVSWEGRKLKSILDGKICPYLYQHYLGRRAHDQSNVCSYINFVYCRLNFQHAMCGYLSKLQQRTAFSLYSIMISLCLRPCLVSIRQVSSMVYAPRVWSCPCVRLMPAPSCPRHRISPAPPLPPPPQQLLNHRLFSPHSRKLDEIPSVSFFFCVCRCSQN
jgi:hypothetical protein